MAKVRNFNSSNGSKKKRCLLNPFRKALKELKPYQRAMLKRKTPSRKAKWENYEFSGVDKNLFYDSIFHIREQWFPNGNGDMRKFMLMRYKCIEIAVDRGCRGSIPKKASPRSLTENWPKIVLKPDLFVIIPVLFTTGDVKPILDQPNIPNSFEHISFLILKVLENNKVDVVLNDNRVVNIYCDVYERAIRTIVFPRLRKLYGVSIKRFRVNNMGTKDKTLFYKYTQISNPNSCGILYLYNFVAFLENKKWTLDDMFQLKHPDFIFLRDFTYLLPTRKNITYVGKE